MSASTVLIFSFLLAGLYLITFGLRNLFRNRKKVQQAKQAKQAEFADRLLKICGIDEKEGDA
ncbi:MAG TPA: hypothetical protein VI320_26385 [Terracidiphilus sp.]